MLNPLNFLIYLPDRWGIRIVDVRQMSATPWGMEGGFVTGDQKGMGSLG